MGEKIESSYQEYKKLKKDTNDFQRSMLDTLVTDAWSSYHQKREDEMVDYYLKAKKLVDALPKGIKPLPLKRYLELEKTVKEILENK